MTARTLIEKIRALNGGSSDGSDVLKQTVIDTIHDHQAEQPHASAEVVERVARAICRAEGWNPEDFHYEGKVENGCYVQTRTPDWVSMIPAAKAALAAMGDGSATVVPVAAETVPQLTPASGAYQKVKKALELLHAAARDNEPPTGAEEDAQEALAVLPALKPAAVAVNE